MSCNGCRVLRKGCSERCILRSCLHWIEAPEAQGNATLFLAKFFGRSDLMSFISSVPEPQRPALFQSLLYEACGRTVNPVNGAVGLLSSGNWHLCEAAVQTVLSGGALRPLPLTLDGVYRPSYDIEFSSETFCLNACNNKAQNLMYTQSTMPFFTMGNQATSFDLGLSLTRKREGDAVSFCGDESDMTSFESRADDRKKERKLLDLFV